MLSVISVENDLSARLGGFVDSAEDLYHVDALLRLEYRLFAVNDHILEVDKIQDVLFLFGLQV